MYVSISNITVVFVLLQSLSLYALVGDQLMVVARSIGSNQYQVMDLVLFIQQIWSLLSVHDDVIEKPDVKLCSLLFI